MYFLKNFHISSRVYGAIWATNESPCSCMCPVLHGDRDKSLDEQVRRSRGVRGEFACDGDGMMDWRRRLNKHSAQYAPREARGPLASVAARSILPVHFPDRENLVDRQIINWSPGAAGPGGEIWAGAAAGDEADRTTGLADRANDITICISHAMPLRRSSADRAGCWHFPALLGLTSTLILKTFHLVYGGPW